MHNIYPFNLRLLSWSGLRLLALALGLLIGTRAYADEVVYRINAGGGATTNSIGTFAADKYFSPAPGYTYTTTKAIANTSNDALYQTERSATTNNGTFSYTFPVSSGRYKVVMHFAELYWTSAGRRLFDVSVEGNKVLDNYDIAQKVGVATATTETFTVSVSDGNLSVYFSALTSDGGRDRPEVGALEIIKVVSSGSNQAPVFAANTYNYSPSEATNPGATIGTVKASDPNGDALTYAITAGNTNKAFAINASIGAITLAKRLNRHTQNAYSLKVRATDAGGLTDEATVAITVDPAATTPAYSSISWGTAASQPYTVSEAQGKAVNGKLYTFGGFDSQKSGFTPTKRAYVFNPVANTWSALAPMPPMNGTQHGGVTHAGLDTDGTDIYFAGGYTANATGTGQIFGTKEVWKYSVATNRYVRLPDLPVTISAGQLAYVKGKLHHIGGTNQARTIDLGNHYALDLDNLSAGWKTLASLPNPRHHAGSIVYEGKIYYIGGQHGHDSKLTAQNDVHVYNPSTNSWSQVADLPAPAGTSGRGHISNAVVVSGNRVLVLGGETMHNTGTTNMVSAYSPASNSWQSLTPLPRSRFSGVAAVLGGTLYYTGGSRSNVTYKGAPVLPASQSLITNVQSTTGEEYTPGKLTVNTSFYTDRSYQITGVPTYLNQASLVKTPNDDKRNTSNNVFSFELTQNATVYVAYDPRATALPAWLSGWQKLTDKVNTNDPGTSTLQLYSKVFSASKVTIGGNLAGPAAGSQTNYIVIAKATQGAAVASNISPLDPTKQDGREGAESAERNVRVYPNPGSGNETIQLALTHFDSFEPVTVLTHDLLGRVVQSAKITTDASGTATLQLNPNKRYLPGLYLIKATALSGKAQTKLVVE